MALSMQCLGAKSMLGKTAELKQRSPAASKAIRAPVSVKAQQEDTVSRTTADAEVTVHSQALKA